MQVGVRSTSLSMNVDHQDVGKQAGVAQDPSAQGTPHQYSEFFFKHKRYHSVSKKETPAHHLMKYLCCPINTQGLLYFLQANFLSSSAGAISHMSSCMKMLSPPPSFLWLSHSNKVDSLFLPIHLTPIFCHASFPSIPPYPIFFPHSLNTFILMCRSQQ